MCVLANCDWKKSGLSMTWILKFKDFEGREFRKKIQGLSRMRGNPESYPKNAPAVTKALFGVQQLSNMVQSCNRAHSN